MTRQLTRVHLAAAILVLALATSAAGAPPSADSYRIKERSAHAGFYFSDDPSDCIQTVVSVTIAESAQRYEPGRQDPVALGAVSIYRYDRCHGYQTLLSANGYRYLQPGEMDFSGNLASAGLNANFDVFDYVTNTQHTATVDLTWTATGPTTHMQSRESFFGPGFRYTFNRQGSNRPAEASGSVLLDSAAVLSGPSEYGGINHVRTGSFSIYHD